MYEKLGDQTENSLWCNMFIRELKKNSVICCTRKNRMLIKECKVRKKSKNKTEEWCGKVLDKLKVTASTAPQSKVIKTIILEGQEE